MHNISDAQLLKAKILIVEDTELSRKMLAHSLHSAGYTDVISAPNGSEGIKMTYEHRPDLVILDLMMPEMDGFSYCESIRKDKQFDTMPIIVQTVLEEMHNKIRAFKLGASDYICKPLDPGELLARVSVHLKSKLLTEALIEYRADMLRQFESARKMQQRIMPSAQHIQMYERVFNMKIAQHFETSSQLGGDCWGMRAISDSRLAIWMYDFSGHGITSAMNVFRLHTIMQELIHDSSDPGSFLTTLNRHLYSLLERHEFCTMFYGVIDTEANCLLHASAAAPPAHIYAGADKKPVSIQEKSFPLGSVKGAAYETKYAPLSPGNLLFIYSDGLIEAKNAAGECVSDDAFDGIACEAIRRNAENPAATVINGAVAKFRSINGIAVPDDITINAYWRCPA